MSHTPGPWQVTKEEPPLKLGSFEVVAITTATLNKVPAYVMGNPLSDEASANARLIAAAPNMLKALKDISEVIHETGEWADRGGWLRAVDEAIIKAEGA